MFCRYCGNTLEPDSVFCEKCGKQVKKAENNTIVNNTKYGTSVNNTNATNRRKNMRVTYPYRAGSFGFTVFQVVMSIIAIVVIILVLADKIPINRLPSRTVDILKFFLTITLIYFTVIFFIKIAKARAIKKTCLTVDDDGIYGVGGTTSYLSVEDVIIRFEDITQVTTRGGLVIVYTLGKKYKFLIDNNESAANIILTRLRAR